ncbi:MAG: SH3 domain-containing protein [Anaerovoracaceae bacterium]
MALQYSDYPFKTMGITQSYNGSYSHEKYSKGNRKDYPVDEAGANTGKDYMYAPFDLIVKRVYGKGIKGQPNTVWLQSRKKVITPIGVFYVTGRATHMSDSELKNIKVGKTFKKGEKLFREGIDGGATGNHIHMTWGTGKFKYPGWKTNNKGAAVLTTTGSNRKADQIFFRGSGTRVRNDRNLSFKTTPRKRVLYINTGKSKLNVRQSYSVKSAAVGKLKNGTKVTVYCTRGNWCCIGASMWVHKKYLK